MCAYFLHHHVGRGVRPLLPLPARLGPPCVGELASAKRATTGPSAGRQLGWKGKGTQPDGTEQKENDGTRKEGSRIPTKKRASAPFQNTNQRRATKGRTRKAEGKKEETEIEREPPSNEKRMERTNKTTIVLKTDASPFGSLGFCCFLLSFLAFLWLPAASIPPHIPLHYHQTALIHSPPVSSRRKKTITPRSTFPSTLHHPLPPNPTTPHRHARKNEQEDKGTTQQQACVAVLLAVFDPFFL